MEAFLVLPYHFFFFCYQQLTARNGRYGSIFARFLFISYYQSIHPYIPYIFIYLTEYKNNIKYSTFYYLPTIIIHIKPKSLDFLMVNKKIFTSIFGKKHTKKHT